jgi:CBS domain-containing protein
MTPFALSVDIADTVAEAEDLMFENEIRHLAVTDKGALVGVVSDRDIAFAINSPDSALRSRLRVREVCSLDVYAADTSEPLERVLSEMAERHIGSVIVTEGEKIAGVFTATDACRCFAAFLRGA